MKLIDDANARMNRQFTATASNLLDNDEEDKENNGDGRMVLDENSVLLDPMANVPLKIHQLEVDELEKLEIEAWNPPLRLTRNERDIVQKPGTVLVLGRSDTGKTVCIINRMVFDATFHRGDSNLHQLFISRSHRIKGMVQGLVQEAVKGAPAVETSFLSYNRLIHDSSAALTGLGLPSAIQGIEDPSKQRGFDDFKSDFFRGAARELKGKLEALVVFTEIRSHIKGSIEAVEHGRPLSLDEYLALGASRCRLDPDQRREAFKVYEKYSQWLESNECYDACDVATDLINRIRRAPIASRIRQKIHFDRIYVDEVQDFTCSDIALFWLLCEGGSGSLFLAGDTAQSVEQGIAFRFAEIRSVCYAMGGGNPANVPSKPLTVNLNFRSHAGVLEVAAVTLKLLHDAFPGAADKLPGDEGIFKGPRPSILSQGDEKHLSLESLKKLVNKNPSLMVLTPDDNVETLKNALSHEFILGICEAKGLDFDEVLLVDFFSSSTAKMGKAWKDILRNLQKPTTKSQSTLQSKHPELEMRIKLLYTAVTRCRHRLFFCETQKSGACEAFTRYVIGTGSLEKQDVSSLSIELKSADEWRSLGIEYAMNGQNEVNATEASAWFERSKVCFQHAGDDGLVKKALFHSSLREQILLANEQQWVDAKQKFPNLVEACFQQPTAGFFVDEAMDVCEGILDRCPSSEGHLRAKVEAILSDMRMLQQR